MNQVKYQMLIFLFENHLINIREKTIKEIINLNFFIFFLINI
jgi:hypothetical protein